MLTTDTLQLDERHTCLRVL